MRAGLQLGSGWIELDWIWNIGPLRGSDEYSSSLSHRTVDINELMSNTKFAGYMFA